MDADVVAVLATMGFVVVLVVSAIVIAWRRKRRTEKQTRRAPKGIAASSHAQAVVTMRMSSNVRSSERRP